MASLSLNAHTSTETDRSPDSLQRSTSLDGTRVAIGLSTLDGRLGGGIPAGRSVLVCGEAGSGKTTLGLQFLATGIAAGERGVLVLVDEKPRHVIADARALGWDLDDWSARNAFHLLDASPYFSVRARGRRSCDADEVARDLARQVRGFSASRLVIDPITSLVPEHATCGPREFLRTLVFALEDNLGCTMVFTAAGGREGHADIAEELVSGVLQLRVAPRDGELSRTVTVRKMRATNVEPCELPVRIAAGHGLVTRSRGNQ